MPDHSPLPTNVRIGGLEKSELRLTLLSRGFQLNAAAEALFEDPRFSTSAAPTSIAIVARSVADLGFAEGATYGDLLARAHSRGLAECPLELGPRLRLVYLEQPDGGALSAGVRGRAPPLALTIASAPLDETEETPKGFYLRKAEGVAWLRGYRSWEGHLWSPEDVFIFAVEHEPLQPT